MKKVISIIAVVALVMSLAVCANAAPKDDIIAAIKAAVPADVYADYEAIISNTLDQIEVTSSEASEIIKIVNETKSEVKLDSSSVADLSGAEKDVLASKITEAAAVVDLKVSVDAGKADADEIVVTVAKTSGEKVVSFETDPVKKTGFELNTTAIMAVSAVVLAAAAVVVFGKNAKVFSK